MSNSQFKSRHAELARLAGQLGSKESRVAFVFKHDNPDEPEVKMGPLSESYAVALRNGSLMRSYKDGKTRPASMVAFNRGHWHKGTAIWGGPGWFEHKTNKNMFAQNPGGGKHGLWRPEGHLRDLQEVDSEWNVCFNEKKPAEAELLGWTGQLFSETLTSTSGRRIYPNLVTPTLLTRLVSGGGPKNWLQLRQSSDLDDLVERIVNRRAYKVLSLEDDLCAPMNGKVTMTPEGYKFESTDRMEPDFVRDVADPTRNVQDVIYRYFGQPVEIRLFPMVRVSRPVVKHEALYTPIEEQAKNPRRVFGIDELKKMRCWGVLQYLAVLSATQTLGADVPEDHYSYVSTDVAYSDSEPWVYLHPDFPRVQRLISDPSAFKSKGISYDIDMMDVPLRATMRSNREKIDARKFHHGKKLHKPVQQSKPQASAPPKADIPTPSKTESEPAAQAVVPVTA